MDNLPLGPMLAVIALLILWAALFTAIEAAQQHLLAIRPGTRQGDKAAARLNFPRNSLIPVSYTHLTLPTSDLV